MNRIVFALLLALGFVVVACDDRATNSITPPAGIPKSPTQFIAFGSSTTTITLAWTAVKDSTGYSLERKAAGTDAFVSVAQVDGQTTSLLDQNLSGNLIYTYRIQALNAQGASPAVEQQAKTNDDEAMQTQNESPIGQPEQQLVGAHGGMVSSLDGQITIQIPSGSVPDGTQITLQGFTNPVEGNPAPGIEVSSSAPFTQPINVSFHYGDEDASDPKNLAMALQEPDGTWIARPYSLDEAARTITLAVPPTSLSQTGISAKAAPRTSVKVLPLRSTFVTPRTANLTLNKTLQLSAYGAFSDYPCDIPGFENQILCTGIGLLIDANSLLRPVNRAIKPLQNKLSGWERYWTVNLKEGGNSEVGTVVTNGAFGAVYTAPDKKPSSNPVEVRFHSIKVSGTSREAAQPVPAKITIKENSDWVTTYFKPVTDNENPRPGEFSYTATMNELRFVFGSSIGNKTLWYDPQGSFTVTSQSGPEDSAGCTTRLEPASITVPLTNDDRGYLTITDPNDPSLSTTPGDYEAIVFGHWTASVIRDGAKCQGRYRNDNVPFGMYFLMTGTEGVGKVTPKITVLSGQNIHSEPGQSDVTWAWSMTSKEPKK